MSIFSQCFPPAATWTMNDIPNLAGKVCAVTGGNSGIGRETVKALLAHNATVYIFARSSSRAHAAIDELKAETGREARFIEVDLASLASVKKGAEEFMRTENKLDILFNNGGVMIPPIEDLTAEGYDLQFGVNVLAHFYLTRLLLPLLLASKGRVVTTSSMGHLFTPLSFDALLDRAQSSAEDETERKKIKKVREKLGRQGLYEMSKYGSVVFAHELAKRYGDRGLVSIAVNPGNIKSDLNKHAGKVQKLLSKLLFYPTAMGALTQLYAGTAPEAGKMNGEYLIPWARRGTVRPDALDPVVGERLWAWMEAQVTAFEGN